MLYDFNLLTTINKKYDICIVGSGPAGITLALNLANNGKTVILLEGGGLEYSNDSQSLYKCESTGHEAWPEHTRLRYFGGTSNHWSGRCRPFETSDFRERHINSLPGWPINYSEIEPFLPGAMEILDLDTSRGFQAINGDLPSNHFEPDAFAKSPPTRFKMKYIDKIIESKNIDCFYNATALDIGLDSTYKSVNHIEIANQNHQIASVKADVFALCIGGIETPRFLLNCNKQISAGIGNSSGMVGRCFMEHLNVPMGSFIYEDPEEFSKLQFFANDRFCESSNIGKSNVTMSIVNSVKSYGRTKAIKTFFKSLACQMKIEDKVQFLSDFKCPGMGTISTLIEQAPNLNSRIMLSEKDDTYGLKKAHLNWKISDYDRRTIRTVGISMAKDFSESGLGKIKLADFILDSNLEIKFGHHAHHMGTTRMAEDAKFGVVDRNLKVHDVRNLYIAGSSVFSTGGACNPTMPIIQLCLRLTDHLTAL